MQKPRDPGPPLAPSYSVVFCRARQRYKMIADRAETDTARGCGQ